MGSDEIEQFRRAYDILRGIDPEQIQEKQEYYEAAMLLTQSLLSTLDNDDEWKDLLIPNVNTRIKIWRNTAVGTPHDAVQGFDFNHPMYINPEPEDEIPTPLQVNLWYCNPSKSNRLPSIYLVYEERNRYFEYERSQKRKACEALLEKYYPSNAADSSSKEGDLSHWTSDNELTTSSNFPIYIKKFSPEDAGNNPGLLETIISKISDRLPPVVSLKRGAINLTAIRKLLDASNSE